MNGVNEDLRPRACTHSQKQNRHAGLWTMELSTQTKNNKKTFLCLSNNLVWDLKSDNLQYIMLVCWSDGTSDSLTKRLTKYFFFIISYTLRALKPLYFHFCNVIKRFFLNDWKGLCIEFWPLVNDLFVPSAQQTSVLYCRLTDF